MNAIQRGLAATLMAALAGSLVAAQTGHGGGTAKLYRIAGVVTNAATGEPVAGATMDLYGGPVQKREIVQSGQTDAEGHFSLDPVPAGKYSLRATRRGYLPEEFNEHDEYSSAIVTGEGQDTEQIPFHLDPGSVVRGVVTDDAGEPVEHANVLLARKTNDIGLGPRLQRTISGQTDDTGLFEFWNLLPGTYFLAVKAEPWYALHPSLSDQRKVEGDEDRASMTALDVAYPVTYYDGVMDESEATPISLKSGERVEANVALHAVPALHLTMGTTGQNSGRQRPMMTMRQTVLGNERFGVQFARPSLDGDTGEVEFGGVAPGHYTVTEGNPPREMEMDVTGSQALDLSAGQPTFTVVMKLRMADGSQLPVPLPLGLLTGNTTQRITTQAQQGKGEARFNAVPPGEWTLVAGNGGPSFGVVSIQSGTGAPQADSRILVKDKALTLNVVLAQGKTSVEGFAVKDAKNEAGVMIVLVPKDPEAHLADFRRDQTDSDGSFALLNAVPGEYTVVAIEDGWELDWAKPEVIGRYLKGGVQVTVPMNAPAEMKLSKPVAVQGK